MPRATAKSVAARPTLDPLPDTFVLAQWERRLDLCKCNQSDYIVGALLLSRYGIKKNDRLIDEKFSGHTFSNGARALVAVRKPSGHAFFGPDGVTPIKIVEGFANKPRFWVLHGDDPVAIANMDNAKTFDEIKPTEEDVAKDPQLQVTYDAWKARILQTRKEMVARVGSASGMNMPLPFDELLQFMLKDQFDEVAKPVPYEDLYRTLRGVLDGTTKSAARNSGGPETTLPL